MEAVLEVLNRPLDKRTPVVALDERPVQLVDSLRPATAMAPGRPARRDYEYARCGTANVFCVVEPKTGRHQTHATKNRTAAQFARALKRITRRYRAARTIHLVLDNLNTHREKSLTATFGAQAGYRLWRRFTVHYTPKYRRRTICRLAAGRYRSLEERSKQCQLCRAVGSLRGKTWRLVRC